jgi:hypothetical protein
MDGVSGDDAAAAVAVFDESVSSILSDGLNGGVQLLRAYLLRGISALESPEMGRQPASPLTENQVICIGIASAVGTILMVICAAIWMCWCCYGWMILAITAVAIGFCLIPGFAG